MSNILKAMGCSAKWLHEYDVDCRLEGDHIFLNFTLAF